MGLGMGEIMYEEMDRAAKKIWTEWAVRQLAIRMLMYVFL